MDPARSMNTPLIDIGHGWSNHADADVAGRIATHEALAGIRHHAPALVTVHASARYRLDILLKTIRQALGDTEVPVIGATASGEYRNDVRQGGVLVTILASPYLRAHVGAGHRVAQRWEDAVEAAVTTPAIKPYFSNQPAHWRELVRRGTSVFGLVFSPAQTRHAPSRCFHILEDLKARSQWQIPFVGGAATDAGHMETNYVFANDEVIEGGLVVAIVETELRFGIGLSHGFQASGLEMEVTGADAHELVTLDHRPALEVFAERTGQSANQLMGRHLTLTTGRGFGHAGSMGLYQLNTAGFATDRGGIQLTRPVPHGTRLRLLDVDRSDQHFDTAADALRKAMMRAHHTRPAAAMMWYCAMRPQLLPARTIDAELHNAAQLLGDAPLLGCFSHGQHGVAQDGASAHYNGGVSVLLIGNELTPCAMVARENEALRAELSAHSAVLQRAHEELEKVVAKRTGDLKTANERLRTELLERSRLEAAMMAQARLEVQETTLREHLQAQEVLFDAIPVPVFHKDALGRYTGCNRAFARFLGREKRDIIGRTVFEVAAGALASTYRDRDLDLLNDPAGTQAYETVAVRADGQTRDVVFHKARILDADGQPVGIIGTILDITDLKAAAQARENALEEAHRLARVRKDFLSNMSHEIRSPLNVVLGLAQAGRRQSAGRKAGATFERILGAGQMLLALVNDILDFSKIESGKLSLADEPFELGNVFDQAISVVARRALEKGLTLQVDEAPDLPLSCRGDALRLAQVLVNLLFNAVKFTDHGSVRLIVSRDGDVLQMSVVDTGIGMTEEQQRRLFSAFEQAETTTTRRFGGTGLGLAITARLVELMQGDVRVTSAPGEGSRFDVRVPMRAPLEAPAARGQVALIGLPEDEQQRLTGMLGEHRVQVVTPSAGCDDPTHTLLLFDAHDHQHPRVCEAQAAGQALALVCCPGGEDVPEDWEGSVIERPIRVRHVLNALMHRHAPAAERTRSRGRLPGVRILAIEDAELNRIVIEELLWDEEAQLTLVEDGLRAIDLVTRSGADAFDVVLTDIQMPGIDGYETARRLHALAPSIPIIGLTAFAMPEEREQCLQAGMVDHVTKPIELDRLIATIRTHLHAPPPLPEAGDEALPAANQAALHAPVDWDALNACFPGKPEVVTRLARSFVRSHSHTLARLQNAIDAYDLHTLADIAHSLKGTAGHLRARALHEAADQACASARAADPQAIVLGRRLMSALERTLLEARGHHPDTH